MKLKMHRHVMMLAAISAIGWCGTRWAEAASMNVHTIVGEYALDYFGGVPPGSTRIHAKAMTDILRRQPESVFGGRTSRLFVRLWSKVQ